DDLPRRVGFLTRDRKWHGGGAMANVFVDTETSELYPIVHRVVCIGYMCSLGIEFGEGVTKAEVSRLARREMSNTHG
ncbi:unnamed protein product, partial [marine sediment metagenome]